MAFKCYGHRCLLLGLGLDTWLERALDLKTANALDLEVPPMLLARVEEVIE
jgi:hypothetical protein